MKTDLNLFEQIKTGDKLAFNTLFKRYYANLCRFAFTYLKDKDTSEEVVQDVFVSLWNQAEELRIDNIRAYLFTMTRNKALNHIQTEQRHADLLDKNYTPDSEPDPEPDYNKFKSILSEKVKELPTKCQEIFVLIKLEGLSYEEASEYLNVAKKTIESQMGIALKKLRESMLPYFDKIFLLIFLAFFRG